MGMEVVELVMVLEDELKIQLPGTVVSSLWEGRADIQVRDFAAMLEEQVRRQIPSFQGDLMGLLRRAISEETNLDDLKITPDSWFKHDLDLE